jgi:hypothetical protein
LNEVCAVTRSQLFAASCLLSASMVPAAAFAQGAPLPVPPRMQPSGYYTPRELDRVVSPIALYPDPLLGQILTAATFSPDIPDAARWADEHHYVPPSRLPAEIEADRLPWEPSVQALLPFPDILGMMASSMPWTEELGDAFLANPDAIMDAVQRQRSLAYKFGYLRSSSQVVVRNGPFIEILPVDPWYIPVPYYDPAVVFYGPKPGVSVRYGYGVRLAPVYAPWGWGATKFGWGEKVLYINNSPWKRTWTNKAVYVHPYAGVTRYQKAAVAEKHEAIRRSEKEKAAEHKSEARKEEHHAAPAEKSKGAPAEKSKAAPEEKSKAKAK